MKTFCPPSALALLAGLLLAACVPSVNPLYTPQTQVFRTELLGVWKEKPDSDESWNFSRGENNSYMLVIQDNESTSTFIVHLVKLGENFFLDLYPHQEVLENDRIGGMFRSAIVPGHLVLKVKLGERLQLQILQPEGLQEMLKADPKALAHGFPEKDRLVITASTDELQKFCVKHADSEKVWGDATLFSRIPL